MLISKYLHQIVGDTITIFVLFNTESHDLHCKLIWIARQMGNVERMAILL